MRYVNLRFMVVFLFVIGAILIVPGCPKGTCTGTVMNCNPMASIKCGDADPNTGRCPGCVDDGIVYDGAGIYRVCVDEDGYSADTCKPHCKCAVGACGRYNYRYAMSCNEMMPFDCAGQGCNFTLIDLCTTK